MFNQLFFSWSQMTSMDDQSALSCPQLFESEVRTVRIQSNDELTSTIERGVRVLGIHV